MTEWRLPGCRLSTELRDLFEQRYVVPAAILALFTLVFHDLNPFWQAQWHADLPWAREHFRVFDSGLVSQSAGTGARVALDYMQFVAVVVSGGIEPCGVAEAGDVRYECIAVPMAARVAHR